MNIQQYMRGLRRAFRSSGLVSPGFLTDAGTYLRELRDRELARGASPAEAERVATRRFGSVEEVAAALASQQRGGRTVALLDPRRPHDGGGRSRPRAPGAIYVVLVTALVVLVGSVALTSRQAPPPTIAEFAPQAVARIAESSGDSGGTGGRTPGEDPAVDRQTSDDTARRTVDVARVRQCVGDPPRQIEDPQSPPCVPYWQGDNGGATWRGVTRDEIRVAIWQEDPSVAPLAAFFNKRFEFYGRRMRMVSGCFGSRSGEAHVIQQADAVCVDEQLRAFASADYLPWGGYSYFRELARRGVVAASHMPNFDIADVDEFRPYLWQYTTPTDQIFANLGRWTCRRLAGAPAAHAGDPLLAARERTFGIVLQPWNPDVSVTADALEAELERCGVRAVEKVTYCFCENLEPRNAVNAVTKLKAAGVNSVLCLCVVMDVGHLPRAATSQGWFPEWLISTYHIQDSITWVKVWGVPPEHLAHTFGLRFLPKAVSWADNPAGWALREMNPSYPPPKQPATNPSFNFETYQIMGNYRTLLLLASGVQLAGPHLTPDTFARGLAKTAFPNPDHPNMAGAVGFASPAGGSDFSMTDDAAEIWWSNDVAGHTDGASGAYCYVDGGARHSLETWPSGGEGFFRGPCDPGGASE